MTRESLAEYRRRGDRLAGGRGGGDGGLVMRRKAWDDLSLAERRQAMAARVELYGGKPTAEGQRIVDAAGPAKLPTPRRRKVQHEAHEMERLALMIDYGPGDTGVAPWWGRGFQRWEARTTNAGETLRSWREGARPGWPDCGLFVPRGLCAVVEMKAPSKRPKRAIAEGWWLREWGGGQHAWHGLTHEQHWWLGVLGNCGFATLVAFSAVEAYRWLDELAGPEPERVPW